MKTKDLLKYKKNNNNNNSHTIRINNGIIIVNKNIYKKFKIEKYVKKLKYPKDRKNIPVLLYLKHAADANGMKRKEIEIKERN